MFGLLLFGFIVGLAFSAYYRVNTMREAVWNIIVAMITSLQGWLLVSLVMIDELRIPSLIVLLIWVLGFLYLKKALLSPRNIRYLG